MGLVALFTREYIAPCERLAMLDLPDTTFVKQPSTADWIFPAISVPILPGSPSIGETDRRESLIPLRHFSV